MVVRRSADQSTRAQQLSATMNQITAAIRQARSDGSCSPQTIKELLDRYCEAEAELRSIVPRTVRSLS
jgi:hypothetical protein